MLVLLTSAGAQPQELHDAIARSSGAMFEAFNACDLDAFARFTTEDIEFYHDQAGLLTQAGVVDSVRRNICGKVRRELVSGSLEVYPIPNHGAVEIGVHRFYETAAGRPDTLVGIAKYVHVWKKTDGGWKLSRAVSYDHKPARAE